MQVFVGRVAMIGFASAILGEIQTGGKGPLGQLALPIQTPLNTQVAGNGRHEEALWHGASISMSQRSEHGFVKYGTFLYLCHVCVNMLT